MSFTVQAREVLSLLGPNGAGKSTTISMLSVLLAYAAAFFGLAVWKFKI